MIESSEKEKGKPPSQEEEKNGEDGTRATKGVMKRCHVIATYPNSTEMGMEGTTVASHDDY